MSSDTAPAKPPLGPRQWPAWAGIGLLALLAWLPWPLQRALGRALGALLLVTMRERGRIASRNLALC
nr:lipid A biosynthesis lauroyl acyltransferase [Lysobacter sp.]